MKPDPDVEARVRASFARQRMMETMGAEMVLCEAGRVALEMPFQPALGQQHGFLHAGAITALMDSAAGYAAMTLMPPEADVLTVELKSNLLSPARGDRFRAEAEVLKSGRTLIVTRAECYGLGEKATLVAALTATMMVIIGRPDLESATK